jgi:hypothetical protein
LYTTWWIIRSIDLGVDKATSTTDVGADSSSPSREYILPKHISDHLPLISHPSLLRLHQTICQDTHRGIMDTSADSRERPVVEHARPYRNPPTEPVYNCRLELIRSLQHILREICPRCGICGIKSAGWDASTQSESDPGGEGVTIASSKDLVLGTANPFTSYRPRPLAESVRCLAHPSTQRSFCG